ncbi:YdcF family protein [Streptomyces sp. NBC_00963]|uniref:YdcF family protein n=1 Tax=unclassified Streptomyces TaxID=2593676 RepID=UPI00386DFC47|nr:YdcF family protein [Streptomyces sp. NBC_00963]WSX66317.1 YdcF family protein [Streptomyces sp. NBC_00932]
MLIYLPAALLLLLFCARVLGDRRRIGNAVLFGLVLVLALAAWLVELSRDHPALAKDVVVALTALLALGVVTLACCLLANGVVMVRKEGASPGNLLSLLSGMALVCVLALLVTAAATEQHTLLVMAATAAALSSYIGFLFLCYLGYAFVYGRLYVPRKADYVVVLGSGLIGGATPPPLLRSRLDRGRKLYERLAARGARPVLLVSGGQGPDEKVPESHAMADYLVEHGIPAGAIEREDRSTSTDENLRFSATLMEKARPHYRCVIVTSNYHAFRAAVSARRAGVRGHVVGAPTAAYFWPSATIREFVALSVLYRRTNLAVCLVLLLGGFLLWWLRPLS